MGEFVKLKNIATITMGQSPKSETINMEFNGIPLLQGNSDIKNNKISTKKYTTALKLKTCKKNDILFTVRAGVGDIYIASQTACIGRGFCSINVNNHLENRNKYIFYYLQKYKPQWKQISQGTTFDSINSQHINNLLIPIKIIKEQEKISDYFSNLDTVINNKQRQLELMGKYKKDLLDKIFNQKIRFKDENGCDYPEWKKAKLGDYITIFPKSKHPASVGLISGKYNFFTTSNKNLYLNEFDIDGDYLIIGDGGVANFKHYNGKFSISDHCWLAKFENLNNNYVKQFLTYKEKFINDLLFQGTGLRNLSRKLFLNFEFPLIDIKEQEKIANLFSNLDLEINILKNSIKNLKEFKIDMLEKMF